MPEKITIDEIRNLIKEEKIKPSRLFGMDVLAEDPVVKGIVKEEVDNAVTAEYTHRKRIDKRFDSDKEDWEKEKEDLTKKMKEKDSIIAKSKVGTLFEDIKEKREFDERETKFIEKKLKSFTPDDPEKVEDELNKFVDDLVDEFTEIRKDVFEEDDDSGKDKDKDKDKDSLTSPRKEKPGEKNVYDENPLIP